ncbi:MAG: hypothetical protein KDC48_24345, partial [Planctomycetes bacterium]|nr:hypothetical protein [Planctomycetota bacterium]
TLPRLACGDLIDWYVEITPLGATLPIGLPAGAPFTFFGSSVTENHIVLVADDCETDQGFTVSGTALDGQWDRGIPVNFNRGDPAADYDGSGQCWLTDNDPTTSNSDVDGGETILTSPIYDVWGLDQAEIVFALWYQNKITTSVRDDSMQIEVSNGGPWVLVETISTNLTGWEERVIHVADHVL